MNPQPPHQGQPFQPPQQGQPYQPSPGQPFQPPSPGQPFQPPAPGQPFQPPQPGQQSQPANPAQPPQAALLPPPSNASPGRSPLWPAAVAVLALATVGAAYWMGTYLAVYGRDGIGFYGVIALLGGTLGGLVAVWSDTASQVRVWGSDLFARTALGWRRLDLANLTSASITGVRGNNSIVLGDSMGRVTFSARKLGPVSEGVRRGLAEAAQQGRMVVPAELAALVGLPVQQGASKRGSNATFAVLGALTLVAVGLILGLVVAS